MKFNRIALAIAAVLVAPSAFAADLTTGVAASNIFWIGGASAQTPGLAKAMNKFCSTTVDSYLDNVDGKSAVIWKCATANTATSGLTGAFIVSKVDAGGSFAGVGPVANHTTMKFPDPTNVTAGAVVAGSNLALTATGTAAGQANYSVGVLKFPQMALSDVGVNVWRARGQSIPSTGFTVNPIFAGQGFGVMVSPSLYAALQADQGLTSTQQPSISKTQYANLVTNTTGAVLGLFPHTATLPAAASTLRISRRSDTSGTQAASDVYFLNNPCNKATKLGGALNAAAGGTVFTDAASGTVVTVVAESSTGNVKSNVGGNAGYAIGVVSLENAESGLGGGKYVAINGASPTIYGGVADTTQKLSVINGLYDFAFESQMITNDIETPAGGTAQNLADRIVKDQGDGANLTTSTGLYADPNNALLAYVTGQTSNYTRAGNECSPLSYFY